MSLKFSTLSLAVVAALQSPLALADDASHGDMERIEVRGRSFNEYKVGAANGAMRGDMSLLETPQSVNVIPDFVTDEQLATNLAEVLVNDSSITAGTQRWNRQVFSLRGFELDSGSGYLANGHQLFAHYVLPIEILSQVEVLKGPSSMLYGQSGPGGLVNMVTKKPTFDRLFELGFDTDEEGSTRFQLDAGGALTDSLRYRAVAVKQDTEYWRSYSPLAGESAEQQERDRWLGFIALDYDISDNVLLSVRYDRTEDKAGIDVGGWLDKDGHLIGSREQIWDMPWAFTDNSITNLGADLAWQLSDNWKLKVGYNDQQFNRQRFDSAPRYNTDAMSTGYQISPFDRFDDWSHKTAYVDLNGEFELAGMEHKLLIGANKLDYGYAQLRTSGARQNVMPGVALPRPDISYKDDTSWSTSGYEFYGVYLQDLISINDRWKVLAGVRFDEQKEDSGNDNAVSPKFGLIWQPQQDLSLYANYSRSFVPQGKINDENDLSNDMELDPEFGTQYELGAKWELMNGGLLLTGALFDIEIDNRIVVHTLDVPVGDITKVTRQDGIQHHKGMELGAQGQVSDSLFLTASMMYLDAEYKTADSLNGKTPIDAPEWSANIWSRYEVTDNFAVNLGAVYVGERFADTPNSISKDGYVRFDMGAAYTFDIGGSEIGIRANVRNLFDTEYLDGGNYQMVTLGQGRHFSLALNAKF
ncbi:TonB-dependent siderophore receptor [Shewanella amazonensis]|uniref:TonB-dependent receptor, putative n=1 Tax=Shewanella amazonensis (strain ATCC BAA-1098 / SB2B) TaxID=326297 RepID=A1SBT7_SHEAM|nr:TonB-dependent siderophore receptor [Shewanella amazonensis]ABM01844.1 TonB-dependent receptor, putative [Shewanella amazonensis SB2B]